MVGSSNRPSSQLAPDLCDLVRIYVPSPKYDDLLLRDAFILSFNTDQLIPGNVNKSDDIIPKSLDNAIDKANPPVQNGAVGISIRNGPVEEMEIDEPQLNGNAGKRKARSSMGNGKSYKEASDDEDDDDVPLVRIESLNPDLGLY